MLPKIKSISALPDYKLLVTFDSEGTVLYDVKEDIKQIPQFKPLETEYALFQNFQIDPSRTCVTWSKEIDLPSDTLLEYGKKQV